MNPLSPAAKELLEELIKRGAKAGAAETAEEITQRFLKEAAEKGLVEITEATVKDAVAAVLAKAGNKTAAEATQALKGGVLQVAEGDIPVFRMGDAAEVPAAEKSVAAAEVAPAAVKKPTIVFEADPELARFAKARAAAQETPAVPEAVVDVPKVRTTALDLPPMPDRLTPYDPKEVATMSLDEAKAAYGNHLREAGRLRSSLKEFEGVEDEAVKAYVRRVNENADILSNKSDDAYHRADFLQKQAAVPVPQPAPVTQAAAAPAPAAATTPTPKPDTRTPIEIAKEQTELAELAAKKAEAEARIRKAAPEPVDPKVAETPENLKVPEATPKEIELIGEGLLKNIKFKSVGKKFDEIITEKSNSVRITVEGAGEDVDFINMGISSADDAAQHALNAIRSAYRTSDMRHLGGRDVVSKGGSAPKGVLTDLRNTTTNFLQSFAQRQVDKAQEASAFLGKEIASGKHVGQALAELQATKVSADQAAANATKFLDDYKKALTGDGGLWSSRFEKAFDGSSFSEISPSKRAKAEAMHQGDERGKITLSIKSAEMAGKFEDWWFNFNETIKEFRKEKLDFTYNSQVVRESKPLGTRIGIEALETGKAGLVIGKEALGLPKKVINFIEKVGDNGFVTTFATPVHYLARFIVPKNGGVIIPRIGSAAGLSAFLAVGGAIQEQEETIENRKDGVLSSQDVFSMEEWADKTVPFVGKDKFPSLDSSVFGVVRNPIDTIAGVGQVAKGAYSYTVDEVKKSWDEGNEKEKKEAPVEKSTNKLDSILNGGSSETPKPSRSLEQILNESNPSELIKPSETVKPNGRSLQQILDGDKGKSSGPTR